MPGLVLKNPVHHLLNHSPVSAADSTESVVACRLCGTMQRLPDPPSGSIVQCAECGERLRWHRPFARHHAAWLAAGALALLVPALAFPMVAAHYLGNYNQFTLIQLVARLCDSGHYLIAVFMTVITALAPATQTVALVALGLLGRAAPTPLRRVLQRAVQIAEPWNMSQMFLLAMLVGVAQFGGMMALDVLPGGLAYALMVALARAAALLYEPADDWER